MHKFIATFAGGEVLEVVLMTMLTKLAASNQVTNVSAAFWANTATLGGGHWHLFSLHR